MKIRNKLLVLYTIIAIIPLILISLIIFMIFNEALTEKSREQLDNISRESSAYLTEFIDSRTADINTISSSLYVKHYLTSNPTARMAFENSVFETLREFINNHKIYSEAMIIDSDGKLLVEVSSDDDQAEGSSNEPGELYSIIRRAATANVLKIIRPAIGRSDTDLVLAKPLIYYSSVRDPYSVPEKSYGYMILRVPMNKVFDAWRNIRFGKTGHVYFIDSEDRIVAHPESNKILTNADFSTKYDVIRRSFTDDGLIGVVLEEPRSELYETSTKLKYYISILLVVVGGIAIVLIYYVSCSFSNRINRIVYSAELVSKGDLDHVIKYRRDDEIGKLAQVLNHMCKQLRIHQDVIRREAAHATVGRSAAMIAHDIRKPFASMKSLLGMIPDKKDDPSFVNYAVSQVDDFIRKAESMLNDILDYSKDEEIELGEVGIQGMAGSALGDVFKNADGTNVGVLYDFKHTKCVEVDEMKVARVFTNIVGNAVDAMKGSGKLWVETRDIVEEGKSWVEVTIANDGPRIGDEHISHLFEPFYTKGKRGGTGLGLAICQKIITAHGGKIEVKTTDERTDLTIRLPAGKGEERINENDLIRHSSQIRDLMPVEPRQQSISEDVKRFLDLHKRRSGESYLLIVDDEPLFRETIRTLINRIPEVRENLHVVEAGSAEIALEQFKARKFDYVISDIDMGKWNIDGYEFCHAVLDKHPDSLVMIHSNKRIHGKDESLLGKKNFQGFLPKPMDEGELTHFLAGKVFEQAERKLYEERKRKNVLVINDEEFMRTALKFELRKTGAVQVLEAAGVSDALKMFKAHSVDVVLADINLGEDRDGFDILREVRSQCITTKFYMMSGMPKEDEWPKAKEMGADGYIQIPYEPDDLRNILN